jgi:hypothetical protein
MRKLVTALLLGTAFLAAPAAQAAPWSKLSCRIVIADWSYSGKYGAAVPMAAVDYLSALDPDGRLGSTINIRSYVAAECRLHPHETVGAAIERLLHTPTSKLPNIPIGGA